MLNLKILVIFLGSVSRISDCARILCVFPFPSVSHQIVFRTLVDELVNREHELVIITADPGYKKDYGTNIKEINIHDTTYTKWKEDTEDLLKNAIENPNNDHLSDFANVLEELFMWQFKSAEFQKIIEEEDNKFDLLLLEVSSHASLVLTHMIKAPAVLLSSVGSLFKYHGMDSPSQDFDHPTLLRHGATNTSFWEEMYDVYNTKQFEYRFENVKENQNVWFKNVIGYDVTAEELKTNIDLMLLNDFPIWQGIRPIPQSVVHLGGVHIKLGNELPQNLLQFINSSEDGVIYVSFGNVVESNLLPPELVQKLVNVLSELPYNVLWKWDKGELPGKGQNILTAKWFPQADLLRHPKIRLFITQGGLQSTDEAIAAGVPLIGIPFLNDQFFNCEKYVQHNIGMKLDVASLTEDDLKAAINKVITDKGYRENIFELRTLMRDKPTNSLTHAISWIEYVLRHKGAKHLESPGANIPWTTYMELELLLIALSAFLLMLIGSIILCYCLCKGIHRWYYERFIQRRFKNGMYFPR